jgi:hypothetical protein
MSIPTIADVVETMSPKAITKRVCRQLITARLSRDLLRQVRSFAIDSGGWNDNEQRKQRCPSSPVPARGPAFGRSPRLWDAVTAG